MATRKTNNENKVIATTAATIAGKELQEQLNVIAGVLRTINFEKEKKTEVKKLCDLLESGTLRKVETIEGRLEFEFADDGLEVREGSKIDKNAAEIGALLSLEGAPVTEEDVKDPDKLLAAIQKYVEASRSAIDISKSIYLEENAKVDRLEQDIEKAKNDYRELLRQHNALIEQKNELNSQKEALEGNFKKYKKASKITTAIVAGVLSVGILVAGSFHLGGRKAKNQLNDLENTFAQYGYSLDDAQIIFASNKNAEEQLKYANKELGEIAAALGVDPTSDLSQVLKDLIDYTANEVTELENLITVLSNECAGFSETVESLRGENTVLKGEKDAAQAKVAELESALKESEAQISALEQRIVELEGFTDTTELQKQLADLKEDYNDAVAEIASLKESVNSLTASNESLKAENEGLKSENDKLESDNKELSDKNTALESENDGLKTENEGLKSENDKLESDNKDLTEENEDLKNQLAEEKNGDQNDTDNKEQDNSNVAVGDREPDNNTAPGQGDKGESSKDDEFEPGF